MNTTMSKSKLNQSKKYKIKISYHKKFFLEKCPNLHPTWFGGD